MAGARECVERGRREQMEPPISPLDAKVTSARRSRPWSPVNHPRTCIHSTRPSSPATLPLSFGVSIATFTARVYHRYALLVFSTVLASAPAKRKTRGNPGSRPKVQSQTTI